MRANAISLCAHVDPKIVRAIPFNPRNPGSTAMVTSLLYGLYAGGVSIAIMLISYFTGMWKTDVNNVIGYLALPFLFLFIWMAMKERKREDYGGTMSYGQGIGTGTMVGLFAGLLTALFMWVYLNNINPEFVTTTIAQRAADMRKNSPDMAPAQRDMAITMMERYFTLFAIGGMIIWDTFIGLVAALIIAIFVRTKPEDQQVVSA